MSADDVGLTEPGSNPTEAETSLVRSSAVVAVGTALSRITGFVRIAAIAYALGATTLAGTYSYANEAPNIVYELLLGGVLTATLVPLFVKHFEARDDDASSAIFTVAMLALAAVTVIGVIAAPWIVDLYTLNVHGSNVAAQQELATDLLRLLHAADVVLRHRHPRDRDAATRAVASSLPRSHRSSTTSSSSRCSSPSRGSPTGRSPCAACSTTTVCSCSSAWGRPRA